MKYFFLLLVFSFLPFAAVAEETIKNFHSDIHVQSDGSVLVTEKITVNSEGRQINGRFYRSLPITRTTDYSVISVRHGGKEASSSVVKGCKYQYRRHCIPFLNVYINLPHDGLYTFEITYRADNIISNFRKYDEIYWNVTGKWDFPIEQAAAKIVLPQGAEAVKYSGYIQGFKKTPCNYDPETGVFWSSDLQAGEELTIDVRFDKGFIAAARLPVERSVLYAALILVAYMLVTWFLFGRDPTEGTVLPKIRGPSGLTPALAGWIYSYGHNKEGCLAASLLQKGLSGFLKFEFNNGLIKVIKAREAQNEDEITFEHSLTFPLLIVDKYSAKTERLMLNLSEDLKKQAEKKYFTSNTLFVFLGSLLLLALVTALSLPIEPREPGFFGILLYVGLPSGKRLLKGLAAKKIPPLSLGGISFFFFLFLSEAILSCHTDPELKTVFLFFGLSVIALIFYSFLIIRPTYEGMRIIACLDGIKMFLKSDDKTLPKGVNFKSMEELLPYVVLLGLEKEWEAKMKLTTGRAYQPDWFAGRFSMNLLSQMNTILSLACSPPPRIELGKRRGRSFFDDLFGGGL